MKKETKENSKVIFIGEERICQQVAYVLAIENYEIKNFDFLKNLTEADNEKYCDYQIYVCEFKRKVRKHTKISVPNKLYKIQYLDDICDKLDKDFFINRRRNRKKSHLKRIKDKSIVYDFLRYIYHRLKGFKTIRAVQKLYYNKVKKEALVGAFLKPSELFLYVLYAPSNNQITCSLLENEMLVFDNDIVVGCCGCALPFGDLLIDGELDSIYHSAYARIIKLSSLNNSYCFCNFSRRCLNYHSKSCGANLKELKTPLTPLCLVISIDKTCNLCCKSCRNEFYVIDEYTRQKKELVEKKLLRSGYLEQAETLLVAGQGEVFYSPIYRRLLDTELKRKNICILSNGVLFNEENWNWLKDKYETVDVKISVDAATKDTYQKLRCGNFDVLLKNLSMLGNLRRCGEIRSLELNFLVQRDNFMEMRAFVELGRSLGVDRIEFQRMVNFGNLSNKILSNRCLIIDESYLDYDLWKVLQDPIFQDPIVDLNGFTRYIEASNSRYANK